MNLVILGYNFNLEILILIGVVYLILVLHTFCGCCKFGLMESFDNAKNAMKNDQIKQKTNLLIQKPESVAKEGFVPANTNYGQSSPYDLSNNTQINTSSWNAPNLTVIPGQPLNPAVKQFLNREPQPGPLPPDEMLMFSNTPFKPECCPNTYSNGSGCACMTGQQYNYLILRGGNNVPYSEY